MIDGHIVYSDTSLADTDGKQTLTHHTYAIYLVNKDFNGWVEVKLNDKHTVALPDSQGHSHGYIHVPGDYHTIQVMTSGATIAVYAVG